MISNGKGFECTCCCFANVAYMCHIRPLRMTFTIYRCLSGSGRMDPYNSSRVTCHCSWVPLLPPSILSPPLGAPSSLTLTLNPNPKPYNPKLVSFSARLRCLLRKGSFLHGDLKTDNVLIDGHAPEISRSGRNCAYHLCHFSRSPTPPQAPGSF